jgi:hypothetical protein
MNKTEIVYQRKPWSISTTVRNPERLRDFLRVLKQLEGQPFNENNQVKYQILLIKERIYKPSKIPQKYTKYYESPKEEIPYEIAAEIFHYQEYEDPPMRGRQSVNPLNKLGFAIARQGYGHIIITELGNKFLSGDYDIGYIFFKSLLKLQFPNPWSTDFSEKEGFNIMPFVAVMHLIDRVNKKSTKRGLNKTEFCLFVPTLINAEMIDDYVKNILEFRKETNKMKFMRHFVEKFYGTKYIPDKKVNNLFDYGDNIMRYFRLTRYFKVLMDPTGYNWTVDLETSREEEIRQILSVYSGEAFKFRDMDEYLKYLSDITKPELPWENEENLKKIATSLKNKIISFISINKEKLKISDQEKKLLDMDIMNLDKQKLEEHISSLRNFSLKLNEQIRKIELTSNLNNIKEIINILRDYKKLRKYEPEHFEKLITEALKIINDEITIKPNYPVDDNGDPISHSPRNKPDIECYYPTFKVICEVTLNISNFQWIQEGQPVMRHLRDFENNYPNEEVLCIFVAPKIHADTYSQFWFSVKYEYDGSPQKIVPLTTEQFSILLETLLHFMEQGKRYSHKDLYKLYSMIIEGTKRLNGYSEWAKFIDNAVKEWQKDMMREIS